jgi:glycosyltransferase involved in cell wall biosynthesis
MKPAVILHTEWSTGWGGQEIRIVSEARGVASRGHRVVIVACPECQILTHARAAGLSTRELPMRHGFDLRAIARLCRIIRDERADIVNTHSSVDSWVGAFAAKLTRVKLVRTRHLSKPWSRHFLNVVHRMPDAIMTTGEAIRQQLIEQNGLNPSTVVSVPTGIDVADFSPRPCADAFKTGLGLPPAARIITNIAVLRRWKRQDVLIDAAALLRDRPDVHVLIAGRGGLYIPGEGGLRVALEGQIERLGLGGRVRLLGHVDDVRPLLSCSDVVVSSSGSHEGVPQSLAQALAMMRPVVATDAGSTRELIVHEQTGLLVPPNDPAALAAAIDRFLSDPALAQRCGERGREHVVAHYSFQHMIDLVLDLYGQLLSHDALVGVHGFPPA